MAAVSGGASETEQKVRIVHRHEISMNTKGTPSEFRSLIPMLQKLRIFAINKKLDMTDAFEEYAGSGYERNMGVMDKNRFRSTMGLLFMGSISRDALAAICDAYKAGHPDPSEPGCYTQVRWKQFAIDFDNVPPPEAYDKLPPCPPALMQAMMKMRADAANRRLDMTDAFEEFCNSLQERNTGVMQKRRFRSTMGILFQGNLKMDVLNAICYRYGCGDPDPQEPGTLQKVNFKKFAVEFDEVPPEPKPPAPDPTPDVLEAMRDMNVYCNLNAIDLEWDFEEYLGGKDACASDVCSRIKFKQALGVLLGRATSLYRHDEEMLERICYCYRAGARNAHDPKYFESVQWREFCGDVGRVQAQPYLRDLRDSMVVAYPQIGELGEPDPEVFSPITPMKGYSDGSPSLQSGGHKAYIPHDAFSSGGHKANVQRVAAAAGRSSAAAAGTTRSTARPTTRSTARPAGV